MAIERQRLFEISMVPLVFQWSIGATEESESINLFNPHEYVQEQFEHEQRFN